MPKKKKAIPRATQANPQPTPARASAPTPQGPQVPSGEKSQLTGLIQALESARNRRAIVYWVTERARIAEAAVLPLYDQLKSIGNQEELDLVLFTRGGDTEVPWRIVTLLRDFCHRFTVLIPHRAHSAGTLLALGADEVVMTPLAVLGPIDPQRTHPLLPRREGAAEPEPISVQDMRHAMQFIREAAGQGVEMPYTPEAMAQIFGALFEKIHPLAIGAIEQSYALSKLVATQCLGTHMDPVQEAAQMKAIVDRLCDDYKSHAYEISRAEARAIGLKVKDAEPSVDTALMDLLKFYTARPTAPPNPPASGSFVMHIAWLDSTTQNFRVEGLYELEKGTLRTLADQWVSY